MCAHVTASVSFSGFAVASVFRPDLFMLESFFLFPSPWIALRYVGKRLARGLPPVLSLRPPGSPTLQSSKLPTASPLGPD